jgi:ABC-type bacteriocin/lantibiotic exporters, contain an N-terminal double-glycine peptidase domain
MDTIKKVFWILQKAFQYCFLYIFMSILIFTFCTVISLVINIINKNIINELISNTHSGNISGIFIGLVVSYMLLYFIQMASGFLRAFGHNFYKNNVDLLFHKIFMWKSYNTSQETFFEKEFMEKYSFVNENTDKISTYIGKLLNFIFSNIGTIIGAMILFVIYEPLLIIYSGIVVIISAIITSYVSKKEFELNKRQISEQRFHDYYKKLLTDKEYAKELRLYNFKDSIYNKWIKCYDKLRRENLGLTLKKVYLNNISAIVRLTLRILAILILLFSAYKKKYDVGTFILLFGLIDTTNIQIENLVSLFISGVFKDTKYLCDYYDFVMPISSFEIKNFKQQKAIDNSLIYGLFEKLELRNVSFIYPNSNKKAVDNVSFVIKKGEIVSILGYNGSGKTTLSKLLNGSFSPCEGEVFFNGKIVNSSNKMEIFKYFGLAPQDYSRFSLPIKELVGLGKIEKMNNSKELKNAYNKAEINEFIAKYSKGDDTILGKEYDEDGMDLSGGEWQSLIIASAYMGHPDILLMDEPTASIDPLKEMEMIKKFRKNLKGETAILISHRIGFARLADRIFMMENGRIIEQGTHEELIKLGGYYSKLFNEQKKLYNEVSI